MILTTYCTFLYPALHIFKGRIQDHLEEVVS